MLRNRLFWMQLVCLLSGAGISIAQITTGTILGTVRDSTGGVVAAATVTIRNAQTGISRTVTTDSAGRYTVPQLGLGQYEVTTEASGFQTSVRSGIELTVGRQAVVDFSLQVGAVAEKVTVTGEAPLVDTTSATVSSLVDEKTMRELPLSGRNFTDLTAIQPGALFVTTVSPTVRTGGGRKISVNGARPAQTLYMLDGVETMNIAANMAPSSVLGRQLGTEAVREFNVLINNYGAQYGRAIGGVVNAVTRSGANDWHGSAYEFFRNDALDANEFFVPTNAPKVPLKQNQFGGTFGGPLRKDNTFFFLAYEGERQRQGVSDFVAVLDADAREGLITRHLDANGNRLPTGLWRSDPSVIVQDFRPLNPWTAAAIRETAVLGNGERLGDGRQRYTGSRTRMAREDYSMARLDQKLSARDSLFGRITTDTSDYFLVDLGNDPNFAHLGEGHYVFAAIQHTRILSPSTLNVFSVGFTRTKMAESQKTPENLNPILDCIPGQRLCINTTPGGVGIDGNAVHGADLNLPFRLLDNVFIYQDQFLYNRGRHAITAGAEVKRFRMNEFQDIWFHGQLRWTGGYGNWFAGRPDFITGPVPQQENPYLAPDVYRGYRQTFTGLYVQDDFKLLPNLTLNVGLRWEKMTDPSEVNNKAGSVPDVLRDSGFTLGKVFEINHDWKGLAPRFGFAWTPFGGGHTVVRGGWGVFTEWPLTYLYTLSSYISPFADRIQIRQPRMPSPFAGFRPGDPQFASVRDPIINAFDWHPAYSYQWNFGIEQQLGQSFVARVSYVGTRTVHLSGNVNPIAPAVKKDQNGRFYTPANGNVANPNFGSFRYIHNGGDAWYNALQLGLERRFRAGLGFRVSYTWAKNIDTTAIGQQTADSSGAISNTNVYDLQADKGLSALDSRRNLIANFNYELPVGSGKAFGGNLPRWLHHVVGGWQLNGVVTVRDGLPLNVAMGFRCSGNGVSSNNTDRPDLRPGASSNPRIKGKRDFRQEDPYFDATAFVAPPTCFAAGATDDASRRGYFGNAGRNTLIGPGLVGTDFSVFKTFRVGEAKSLQFRAEVFNLLNRPNFRLEADQAAALTGPRTFQTDSSGRAVIDPATGYPVPGGRFPNGQYNTRAGLINSLAAGTTMRQIQLALKFEF